MDKNIIKKYLTETFLTEAKKAAKPKENDGKATKVADTSKPTQEKKSAEGTQGVPGVKVTGKVKKESGTSNKAGVKAIAKDMKDYESSSTKSDTNAGDMATNKFNYNGKEEETYHNDMEIMNGMEMLQYDRTPDENFKERALEAIEGSSRMGNNPEWANVVEKGWGGDKEFGKNLAKRIKASVKKRDEQTPTSKMFGNDWEVIKDKGNRPYAFENAKNKKPLIKETLSEKGVSQVLKMIQDRGLRPTAIYLVDLCLKRLTGGLTASDLGDTSIYANGLDQIEELLQDGSFDAAIHAAKETAEEMVEDEGMGMGMDMDETMGMSSEPIQTGENSLYENKQTNNPSGKNKNKQSMKRLNFKKEFNGVANALKLIPESYRVDNKVFEMTDGNESYKIRWEGSLNEGAAVVLTASDKKMVNEDMQRMKALFNYKSQDTLGLVKGKDRIDENASFSDIYAKTKKLLGESEDIEGQTADHEGEWDDAGVTHAPEAKKHMVQASKMENGHQAPKPKEGQWAEIKPAHAADAKKHVQGSVSTDNGHQAPAPKEGHWEQIKIKGTTGVKNTDSHEVTSQAKTPKKGQFDSVKKHAPEASKNIQGSTSSDKGTQAPAPKKGDWDKVKKSAPEASKHVSESKKKLK